ncbi:MAG: 4Fe-4S dicluster domain-containing protein [Chloroflexi bacterium]|nr:4Fe-4S dicluster domain-containing protein [Chloroflexota bacterium]
MPVELGPRLDDLSRCVHCGLCLQSCPTYVETGLETESPRGRLYLMRARAEGRIRATPSFLQHMELCLVCRNCEAVCPSGVPYGRIMEAERAQLLAQKRGVPWQRGLRLLVFRGLLPHPGRLRLLAGLLRLYQRSGLQRLVRRSGLLRLLPRAVVQMESLLPPAAGGFLVAPRGVQPFPETALTTVALLSGCVMPYLYPEVHEATLRVLARNGYRVEVSPGQGCCGALHLHSGEREEARRLARRNIDAFLVAEPGAIVTNAAGCGASMKEYTGLLQDDPAYADKARRFSSLVRDITELLAMQPLQGRLGPLPIRVTYQDSCHLAHAQRIRQAPRELLRAVPGLELVEMRTPDACCGSAGVYNITQREMAQRLLVGKMQEVAAARAEVVVTANPGCMLQLAAGLRQAGLPGRVAHVVEVLDWAYGAAEARPAG